MQAELTEGLQELLGSDLAESFTWSGGSFSALVDDERAGDVYSRDYRGGERFDSVVIVDTSVAAFSGGLPGKGAKLTHSDGRIYSVIDTESPDGAHVAFFQCRKGSNP